MHNSTTSLSSIIPQLILIIILTAINAFFSSAEMAIVSVNKTKIKQLSDSGDQRAKLVEKLMNEPSKFLSTIQIGITLASFFSSASAATGLSGYFAKALQSLNIPYYQSISMVLVTFILSYVTLIFGELVPKRVALQKAEKISLSSVKIINFISVIARPFIKFLSLSSAVVLKLTGNSNEDVEEKISEEQIRTLIAQSQEEGSIDKEESKMINSVFQFNDKLSKEVMKARKDTFAINIDSEIDDIIDEVIDYNYSRIPVYKNDIDNIIGILYIKDLLLEARRIGFKNINLEKMLHKPFFVPETKKTNELFRLLQEKKIHLALLIDEYGGFSGLVTIEDLVEEIMGEIEDEYDQEPKLTKKIEKNKYLVKGIIPINEFNELFDLSISHGEYDTLNGYLISNIGEIPKEGLEIKIEDINYKIIKIEKRRIENIEVYFDK